MSSKPNPRRSNGSKRTRLRNRVRAMGLPCHICGQAIDYDLPAGHPMSYELDELVPVSRGGDPYDPDNVAPAHRICNQRRGNRMPCDGVTDDRVTAPCVGLIDWVALCGEAK